MTGIDSIDGDGGSFTGVDLSVDNGAGLGAFLASLSAGDVGQRAIAELVCRIADFAAPSPDEYEQDDTERDGDTDNCPDCGDRHDDHDRDDDGQPDQAGNRDEDCDSDSDSRAAIAPEPIDPEGYLAAMLGLDVLESVKSALAVTESQLITHAYTHADEGLRDPSITPDQIVQHADGTLSRVPSRTAVVATDLALVHRTFDGRARMLTEHAVLLCHHMPHTLRRLQAGELTSYQASRITTEASALESIDDAETLDETVCGRAFSGSYIGLGEHRAPREPFNCRLRKAVNRLTPQKPAPGTEAGDRDAAFRARHVRFGLTQDGMTNLYGSLPAVDAAAIDTMLDDYARTAPEDDERTLEQRRADVFTTLFLGPAVLSPPAQYALNFDSPSAISFDDSHDDDGGGGEDGDRVAANRERSSANSSHRPKAGAATCPDDGYIVLDRSRPIDRRENLTARSIFEQIRLLAACLDWTIPNPARAFVNIDITAETLARLQHETQPRPESGTTEQPCPKPEATNPCPDRGSPGQPCPDRGLPGQPCLDCGASRQPCSGRDASEQPGSVAGLSDDSGIRCESRRTPSAEAGDAAGDVVADSHGPHGPGGRFRDATVRGIGSVSDDELRGLLAFADLRRIITDTATGQPIEVSRRRPSQALRDAIVNRDRRCRFPGCSRTAAALDLDHIEAYRDDQPAAGQTVPANLQALCRTHHRAKHHLRWTPVMNADGSITWRNNLLGITAAT